MLGTALCRSGPQHLPRCCHLGLEGLWLARGHGVGARWGPAVPASRVVWGAQPGEERCHES